MYTNCAILLSIIYIIVVPSGNLDVFAKESKTYFRRLDPKKKKKEIQMLKPSLNGLRLIFHG